MSLIQAYHTSVQIDPINGYVFEYEPILFPYVLPSTNDELVIAFTGIDGEDYITFTQTWWPSDNEAVLLGYNTFRDGLQVSHVADWNLHITANTSLTDAEYLASLLVGDDTIDASVFDDEIWGLGGNDYLLGNGGNDLIYGNQGSDLIYGKVGNDTIFGGQHEDIIFGGQDIDIIYGNFQNDIVYGNLADDVLYGGQNEDVLYGGQGHDTLFANNGNDTLFGNLGDDVLHGGPGLNHLIGGAGADIFYIDADDVILDQAPEDTVVLL